jgi:2-polyprenyl-3-methyl-5-hydroxy-6-metoxy-1,4-benzoquinol methylase
MDTESVASTTPLRMTAPTWTPASLTRLARSIYGGARLNPQRRFTTVYRPFYGSFDEILRWVPAGARMVDIGCGSGVLLLLAKALRQLQTGQGFDVDAGSVAIATAANPWPEISFHVAADVPEPVLADSNVVSIIDVLHHLPSAQHRPFLRGLLTKIAPGTTVIIKDLQPTARWRALANRITDFLSTGSRVDYIALDDVKSILSEQGFTICDASRFNRYVWSSYLIVAQKPR